MMLYQLVASLVVLVVLASCQTSGKSTKPKTPRKPASTFDGLKIRRPKSGPMVFRAGSSYAVMPSKSRSQWVQIRKSTKNDEEKLFATLGSREWDISIDQAKIFLRNNPKNLSGLIAMSAALAMNKKYDLAAFYAGLIAKYHGNQPEVFNIRGLAIISRPNPTIFDLKQSIQLFQRSFDYDRDQVAPGLNLGYLYLSMGDTDKAVDIFAKTRDRCNRCVESLMGFGVCQSRLGNFELARSAFIGVLKKRPADGPALYRLALVERAGFNNNPKAKEYLEQILTDPRITNNAIKRRARFLLDRIRAQEAGINR